MKTKTHSAQLLRKRKFFLFLPLLGLPFTTLLFWALGGGKGSNARAGEPTAKGGLNMQLPDAYLKDEEALNKLSYYEKAVSDSAKLKEQMKSDPNYLQQVGTDAAGLPPTRDTMYPVSRYNQNGIGERTGLNASPLGNSSYLDPNEARVYSKLNELNKALNQTAAHPRKEKEYAGSNRTSTATINSADIDRLERMINTTRNGDNSEDPEMEQLNGMIEKILDIQHPERVKERLKQTPNVNKEQVHAVTSINNNDKISLLTKGSTNFGNVTSSDKYSASGFYSLEDDMVNNNDQPNAIQAVIHETQTVVEGAIVKLRLVNDLSVNGTLVPKGSFLFGTAALSGERLNIKITGIRYKNSLFPVQLSVVDMDGLDGVYVPGAITRDVVGNSAERTMQGIGITALNPSLGAQAAGAGIEAAKTFLGKKAKLIKVTLKAGYQVLLRDDKKKASS